MPALEQLIEEIGERARCAARLLAMANRVQKDAGLVAMADELLWHTDAILAANATDVAAAAEASLSPAMIDRLRLDRERIQSMADSMKQVAALPDPVGSLLREWTQPNGLQFSKVRVPLGVIGFIYESRPNVTSDAAALCVKSGNAVILRGGSESLRTNLVVRQALEQGLIRTGLPGDVVQLVPVADRDAVRLLGEARRHIDLLIPRGGRNLIETVVSHARVPLIKHFAGICAV